MRILIVEDDERIAQALTATLKERQYIVDWAADGQKGWDFSEAFSYDLILLDIALPKMDGVTLCKRLRQSGCMAPILMLTARDTSEDKVIGLDAGADDYVIKPFNLAELTARIRALLRRGVSTLLPVLEWERLILNPSNCEVTYNGQLLHLTPKEYALLELFLRNSQQVFSRQQILDQLWTWDDAPTEEAVKVHIKELRKKLRAVGASPDWIETVYGLGYRLKQR